MILANTLDSVLARIAAEVEGVPAVWAIHEPVDWRKFMEKFGLGVLESCARIFHSSGPMVYVSEELRTLYPANQSFVIPNRLPSWEPHAPSSPQDRLSAKQRLGFGEGVLVVVVGIVGLRKRPHDVIQAVQHLNLRGIPIELAIVGDFEPGESAYVAQLRRAAADGHVRLTGRVPDATPFFQAADILVLASSNESFSLVVLEAMAHGVAIVATPVFAKELLVPGTECLLFDVGDIVALEGHLAKLALDQELREAIGRAGWFHYRQLTTFEEQVAAYGELLK